MSKESNVMEKLLDREVERYEEGVEVPFMKDEYYEWLEARKELSEGSKVNYKIWLNNADDMICVDGNDFYALLKNAFEGCEYDRCEECLGWYDGLLTREIEREDDKRSKAIRDWRSAFRKYADFMRECMAEAKRNERIRKSRESASSLFLENRFFGWMISPDNARRIAVDSAESYVSYIKSANKKLFCKTGYDILAMIPGFIKTKNVVKINEMFDAMDGKLTERINEMNETEMPLGSLNNSRTALRRYAEFIKSIVEQI